MILGKEAMVLCIVLGDVVAWSLPVIQLGTDSGEVIRELEKAGDVL